MLRARYTDGDKDCDLFSIIDSLPRIKSSKEYKPVPPELGQRIHELCDKHHVAWPEWIQKSTDWKTILVLGWGVKSTKLTHQLTEEVKQKFSEFKLKFVESGPSHIHLCQLHPSIYANKIRSGTCQLIVASEKNESKTFYAVTTAHTFLTEDMCKKIDEGPTKGSDARNEVDIEIAQANYELKIETKHKKERSLELDGNAMYAFRKSYFPKPADDNEYYLSYPNDIAIMGLTSNSIDFLRKPEISFKTQEGFPVQGLRKVISPSINLPNLLNLLKEREIPVYVHEHQYRITKEIDEGKQRLIIFSPVTASKDYLTDGYSGSILYTKDEDGVKMAIGMFMGYNKEDNGVKYAIPLQPALRELEYLYNDEYLTNLEFVDVEKTFR